MNKKLQINKLQRSFIDSVEEKQCFLRWLDTVCPGSLRPKFEHKLRRHKQRFGKITTTVVLENDEYLLRSGLQPH